MSKLLRLSIDDTEVEHLHDDTFNDLTSLEELTIRRSFLTALPANIFSSLGKMRSFDGKFNKLSKLHENLFSENFKMESIDFSGNNLKEITIDFKTLQRISEIYLLNCGCINSYFFSENQIFTLTSLQFLIKKRCLIK